MIEAIIIDDEPKAIELLTHYCVKSQEVFLLKSFRNPIEALECIEHKKPQLIFLDINMPNLSGIQLAKLIPAESHIVFTTAYSEYAVESYNLSAIDYLLKPITYQRFLKALDKVVSLIKTKNDLISKQATAALIIKSGYDKYQLNVDDILYLEKDGNYMIYHTLSKTILARETISEALKKLPNGFMQTHKSFIVSIKHIEKLKSKYAYINDVKIPVSSRYKLALEHKLT